MQKQPDVFAINGFMRFYLVVEVLAPLALIGITVWAISTPYIELSTWGPLVLLGLLAWAVRDAIRLARWFAFSVAISPEGIAARGKRWTWDQIRSARARAAFKFQTFIELVTEDGSKLLIPAAIQQDAIVLTLIEKYVPNLVKEG